MKFSNPHEIKVYQHMTECETLKIIVPRFFGFADIPAGQMGDHMATRRTVKPGSFRIQKDRCLFVIIEDLLDPFSKPVVSDIKLGKSNYEDDDSEKTKQRHIKRAQRTGMDVYGGRFDGITVHGQPTKHKKALWNHSFPSNLRYFLLPELNYNESIVLEELPTDLKSRFKLNCNLLLKKLNQVHVALGDHRKCFNFLQSSLLLIYESDLSKEPRVDVRIIDFDHTHFIPNGSDRVIAPTLPSDAEPRYVLGNVCADEGVYSLIELVAELESSVS